MLHFERVPRLRALDEHGTGQDVPARALVGDGLDDRAKRCLNVFGLHASRFKPARCVREQRIDVDDVA